VENWLKNDEYNNMFQNFEDKEESDDFEILDPVEMLMDNPNK